MAVGVVFARRSAMGLASDSFHPYPTGTGTDTAQRKLHTQATDLSKIFAGIQPPEGKRLAARGHCIPLTAVAESYYWRGRIGVVLLEMRMAHRWLEKAWDMCPEEAWQQRR